MQEKSSRSYHVSFDCGNSSFRVMLGSFVDDRLIVEIIDQVPHDPILVHGRLYWDILKIFDGLKKGLKRVYERTGRIDTIGVTTWGIDFGILSHQGNLMANPLCYRNTLGVEAYNQLDEEISLQNWAATGIQNHPMNSVYQIEGIREKLPEYFAQADRLLFIPDLLIYLFTGEQATERSIASTSQLYDMRHERFSHEMMVRYDLSDTLFAPLVPHGAFIGMLKDDICSELHIPACPCISTPSHDTASAVVAVPEMGDVLFLSSGTWSLIGAELDAPLITQSAYLNGFTNEAGAFQTITFLKNATGLYLLQQIKKNLLAQGTHLSWDDINQIAKDYSGNVILYDSNCAELFSAQDVVGVIAGLIGDDSYEAIITSTYHSLAACYGKAIKAIREITGKDYEALHIIGGGSQDRYLNQLTADRIGLPVIAGPVEAASIGNICVQRNFLDSSFGLKSIRRLITRSFDTERFEPEV